MKKMFIVRNLFTGKYLYWNKFDNFYYWKEGTKGVIMFPRKTAITSNLAIKELIGQLVLIQIIPVYFFPKP